MTRAEFEAELRKLLQGHETGTANERCVECVACERCVDCTFCRGSKALQRCHYCVDSQRCADSTHCRGCRDLLKCSHCVASERCTQSSYLVRSVDCTGCTYCFGCVGLVRKDFHILNQPYDRSTYFALTSKLMRELGLGAGAEPGPAPRAAHR
ncbi:caib/baif family protein [Sorangium cellulosum]|uniref:Caib/baif family protein n=1 Tax=Sorangium cellulosum TaxID=56 RepID=A0A2L0F3Q4_SORCE|nr:hypothetical protein [Sorangium cellulosum]AUX46176.1 caib/baif family protein [Sorangium cellulosum]